MSSSAATSQDTLDSGSFSFLTSLPESQRGRLSVQTETMKKFRREVRTRATILRLQSILLLDSIDKEGETTMMTMPCAKWGRVEHAVGKWAESQKLEVLTELHPGDSAKVDIRVVFTE